ncbi:MAG TPA: hypothetical protein VKP30_09340 [Polyangiaceae bacterium]|nr:hypothetical protein [Polyangiaceae bacterium]
MVRPILAVGWFVLLLGCDKRTPEEKGRDYADDKLGFVQGASQELAKRGKGIGEGLGKGVGELVKSAGGAVKDVAHPPVKVALAASLKDSGLGIGQANEGADTPEGREVVVHLRSDKGYAGLLRLEGHGAEQLVVQSTSAEKIELAAGGAVALRFLFDSSVRLSKLEKFELLPDLEHEIRLSDAAVKQNAIELSQLSEKKTGDEYQVTVYAVFKKATNRALSLRAYDPNHNEISRSKAVAATPRKTDSAGFLTFTFDGHTPVTKIRSYELFVE